MTTKDSKKKDREGQQKAKQKAKQRTQKGTQADNTRRSYGDDKRTNDRQRDMYRGKGRQRQHKNQT